MSASLARIQRRLRTGARHGNIDSTDPNSLRLVLRELLFDSDEIPKWRRAAACRDASPEIFYPPQGWAGSFSTATAVQICAGCPVRSACLADALAWERPNERHGVLGGLTGPERAALAQRLANVPTDGVGGAAA